MQLILATDILDVRGRILCLRCRELRESQMPVDAEVAGNGIVYWLISTTLTDNKRAGAAVHAATKDKCTVKTAGQDLEVRVAAILRHEAWSDIEEQLELARFIKKNIIYRTEGCTKLMKSFPNSRRKWYNRLSQRKQSDRCLSTSNALVGSGGLMATVFFNPLPTYGSPFAKWDKVIQLMLDEGEQVCSATRGRMPNQ